MVICLEQGANDLYTVQPMPLPPHRLLLQTGLTSLVPVYQVVLEKRLSRQPIFTTNCNLC